MCVSYCGLNKVTKPFECPIPRCDNAITLILVGSNIINILTVDAKQCYHQIAIYVLHREKLDFFAPNNRNCAFKVIPFGPMNAPAFYACMMQDFHTEWDLLFILKFPILQKSEENLSVLQTQIIFTSSIVKRTLAVKEILTTS